VNVATEPVTRFLAERRAKPARSKDELTQRFGMTIPPSLPLDVRSDFFSVRVQVAQEDVELSSEALLQRDEVKPVRLVWLRPRY
jgi:hypothetical protein